MRGTPRPKLDWVLQSDGSWQAIYDGVTAFVWSFDTRCPIIGRWFALIRRSETECGKTSKHISVYHAKDAAWSRITSKVKLG